MDLNIEPRRDAALSDVINSWLDQRARKIPFEIIQETLSRFADFTVKEKSLVAVFERVSNITKSDVLHEVTPRLLPLFGEIRNIKDQSRRCMACCYALLVLQKTDPAAHKERIEKIHATLDESWMAMDDSREKVEAGFRIAVLLASDLKVSAASYVSKSHELKKVLGAHYDVSTQMRCLSLAIRSFSGLLPQHIDFEDDYVRLSQRINRIPSRLLRVQLWSDLSLRSYAAKRAQLGNRIVTEQIQPLLAALKSSSTYSWFEAVSISGPALYCHHRLSSLDTFRQLPSSFKDYAIHDTIDFINRKVSLLDPFDSAGSEYDITYEEAVDICELLGELDRDGMVFAGLRDLVNSALLKRGVHRFTENERLDLKQRLQSIAGAKFRREKRP
jgi:hypothetical protein